MTEVEFSSWLPRARDGYADDMVRNGGADASAARAKAERDSERLFPGGRPSSEQQVFVIEADGARVGELWLSERESGISTAVSFGSTPSTWTKRIVVVASRAPAMELAEREAIRRGLTHVALNVFGGNQPARNLFTARSGTARTRSP